MGSASVAVSLDEVDDTLIVSGPVFDGDLARLRDVLLNKSLRRVLLRQSPGGDAWTGQRLGLEIRQAGLDTWISGRCASACDDMSMGGTQRRLTDDMPVRENRLLLHGASCVETGKTRPDLAPGLALHIQRMTDRRYPKELVDFTVNSAHAQDFMAFAITPRMLRSPQPHGVFRCLIGARGQRLCQELPGHCALTTGLVTQAEIVSLSLALRVRLPR